MAYSFSQLLDISHCLHPLKDEAGLVNLIFIGGETEAYGCPSVVRYMLNQTGTMWVRGIRGLGKGGAI